MSEISELEKLKQEILFLKNENQDLKNNQQFGLVFEEKEEFILLPLGNDNYLFDKKIFTLTKDEIKIKEKSKSIIIDDDEYSFFSHPKENSYNVFKKDEEYFIIRESKLLKYVSKINKEYNPLFVEKNQDLNFKSDDNKNINYLIEGDNYLSLQLLKISHFNKIDVIYIDPPYNTGKQDFKYNDKFVDENDGYKHSKWLSFMKKRLEIAYDLLKEDGIIFISIDDYEQHRLKMLCDQIFGEKNSGGTQIVENNPGGRSDNTTTAISHEYLLIYFKNINYFKEKEKKLGNDNRKIFNYKSYDSNILKKYTLKDSKSLYKKGPSLVKGGGAELLKERTKMGYSIYYKSNEDFKIIDETYFCENTHLYKRTPEKKDLIEDGYIRFIPPSKRIKNIDELKIWRWGDKKFINEIEDLIFDTKNKMIYTKDRLFEEFKLFKQKSIFNESNYTTATGKKDFEKLELFDFDFPKAKEYIKRILEISTKKNAVILDFFAGSGTTGHAVQELNSEDGGNRQYILCTNNENNICQNITYERLSRINNPELYDLDSKKIKPLPHNLIYLKTIGIDVNNEDLFLNEIIHIIKLKENVFINSEYLKNTYENKEKLVHIFYCNDDIKNILSLKEIDKEIIIYIEIMEEDLKDYIRLNKLPEHFEYKTIPQQLQHSLKLIRN